jgi:tetratricopeptide (TPR) repeat protein
MIEMDPSADRWNDRLSEYLDDELETGERAELETHLAACVRCRTDLEALQRVAARAAALPDVPPDADLWPGIAARISPPQAGTSAKQPRRFAFTMPQLIAASLALMVLSGGMVWVARLGGPQSDFPATTATGPAAVTPAGFADSTYDAAVADLQKTLETDRARLDKETLRVFEENLGTIDRAIDQCRAALAADPASAYLNTYLAETLARKLSLLRRATGLVDRSS